MMIGEAGWADVKLCLVSSKVVPSHLGIADRCVIPRFSGSYQVIGRFLET